MISPFLQKATKLASRCPCSRPSLALCTQTHSDEKARRTSQHRSFATFRAPSDAVVLYCRMSSHARCPYGPRKLPRCHKGHSSESDENAVLAGADFAFALHPIFSSGPTRGACAFKTASAACAHGSGRARSRASRVGGNEACYCLQLVW